MNKEIKLVITDAAIKKLSTILTLRAMTQNDGITDEVLHKIIDAVDNRESEILINTKDEREGTS